MLAVLFSYIKAHRIIRCKIANYIKREFKSVTHAYPARHEQNKNKSRLDRNSHGGGVMAYVKRDLFCTRRRDLEQSGVEIAARF